MPQPEADRKEESPSVPADELRQALGDFLDRALKGGTTVITRHGKPVARLVPIEDSATLQPAA